jgi:glucokinase
MPPHNSRVAETEASSLGGNGAVACLTVHLTGYRMTDLVAVDIGGTHARFALATVGGGQVVSLGEALVIKTAEHANLRSAWKALGEAAGVPLPSAAAIAVAAAIDGDEVCFTNNPWVIRPATIGDDLGVGSCLLLNDFAAVAHAVGQAGEGELLHLCGPASPLPASGTICVVGPGTGLGVACLHRDGSHYRVTATEGGHVGFAPSDGFEDALLQRMRERHGRVSVERVASGPGLGEIYAALAAQEGTSIPQLPSVELWSRALSGDDQLTTAALDRFCGILGSAAGDLALAQGADAVVIAGGLGFRIREHLHSSGFAERFRDKGRFRKLMEAMPVKLIVHPQPGLFGAAAAFAAAEASALR